MLSIGCFFSSAGQGAPRTATTKAVYLASARSLLTAQNEKAKTIELTLTALESELTRTAPPAQQELPR